jgi:hypothetical protein
VSSFFSTAFRNCRILGLPFMPCSARDGIA